MTCSNFCLRYENPIDTVQQLVDSDMEWGATHDAWIFSILLSTEVCLKFHVIYKISIKLRKHLLKLYIISAKYSTLGEEISENSR